MICDELTSFVDKKNFRKRYSIGRQTQRGRKCKNIRTMLLQSHRREEER